MKASDLESAIARLRPHRDLGAKEMVQALNALGLKVDHVTFGETFNQAIGAKSLLVDVVFKLPQGHRDSVKVSVGASMAIRKLVGKPVVVNFFWSKG